MIKCYNYTMKNNNKLNKLIAIIEIVGGAIGLFIIVPVIWGITSLLSSGTFSLAIAGSILIFVLGICLYILSVIAGVALWRNSRKGVTLSLIVQAVQIPSLVISGFIYSFISGLAMYLYLDFQSGVWINFNISMFRIYLSSSNNGFVLGINVIALLAFIYLWKLRNNKIN